MPQASAPGHDGRDQTPGPRQPLVNHVSLLPVRGTLPAGHLSRGSDLETQSKSWALGSGAENPRSRGQTPGRKERPRPDGPERASPAAESQGRFPAAPRPWAPNGLPAECEPARSGPPPSARRPPQRQTGRRQRHAPRRGSHSLHSGPRTLRRAVGALPPSPPSASPEAASPCAATHGRAGAPRGRWEAAGERCSRLRRSEE